MKPFYTQSHFSLIKHYKQYYYIKGDQQPRQKNNQMIDLYLQYLSNTTDRIVTLIPLGL